MPNISFSILKTSSVAERVKERDEREYIKGEETMERQLKIAMKQERTYNNEKKPKKGRAPHPLSIVAHAMEYWVPHGSFDVCAKVLI